MAPQGPYNFFVNFTDQNNKPGAGLTDIITIGYTAAQKIWIAAYNAKCQTNSGQVGNGCAVAVNKVLLTALGYTIPNRNGPALTCGDINGNHTWGTPAHTCSTEWVPDVVEALTKQGHGYAVPQSQAVQGDLAVQDGNDAINGMNHIGICENNGCTAVLSNMSSTGQLCGETNATMSSNGYPYSPNLTPTFYHIN